MCVGSEHQNSQEGLRGWSSRQAAKAPYMCYEGVVDGGVWVTGPARLHCLLLSLGAGCCRLLIVVLEGRAGPLLQRRMAQDCCHTQLHLEVQKVIPGVFKEQILFREGNNRDGGRDLGVIKSITNKIHSDI